MGPSILLCVKVLILAVDLIHLLLGYIPSGYYLSIDNVHNILSIPSGLFAIYCFNIYMSIISECLQGNTKRLLGKILLVQFILFNCLRLFFIFLTGTGMLTCVYPFLSQNLAVHLLKNIMKGFLSTFISFPFLNICGQETVIPQLILTGGTNTSFETPEVIEGFETEPDNTIINTKEKLQVQTTDDVVLVLQK